MKYLGVSIFIIVFIQICTAPPPRRQEIHEEKPQETEEESYGFEYDRYLKEVIQVLESDPEFRRKLEAAEETDIRNGKIAHELEYVNHQVRSKLDEIKRAELERLRILAQKEFELNNDIDTEHMKISPEHLHHENQHTFEIEDLKKLIAKVTKDLNEVDKKRRAEFKEYEMQKEFENQEKLKHLEGTEKEAFEKQLKDNETKHKQHDPLHHPGSKQQLEEVWEKQDHMDSQEFNPKVFFQLHDIDGNGFWDQNEVKALFIKELDKMYEAGAPEDDMRERAEELERMREHVFKEADKNHDQLISFQEFMDQTKEPEFNKDPGWETIDQQPVYTHEDYLEFEKRRQEEIQKMIQQGLIPPQPVYHPDPYQQFHPGVQQHFPQGNYPHVQQQGHPGQVHGQQAQHPPQYQQVHPGQVQYQQVHPGQEQHPPQPQYQQGHPGQQQYQQGHPAQQQYQQDHPSQQQYQQGHPAQQQYQQAHPGQAQPTYQQVHPGQAHNLPQPQYQQVHQGQAQNPPQAQHPSQPQYQPVQHEQKQQISEQNQNAQHPPQYQQPQSGGGQQQGNAQQHPIQDKNSLPNQPQPVAPNAVPQSYQQGQNNGGHNNQIPVANLGAAGHVDVKSNLGHPNDIQGDSKLKSH